MEGKRTRADFVKVNYVLTAVSMAGPVVLPIGEGVLTLGIDKKRKNPELNYENVMTVNTVMLLLVTAGFLFLSGSYAAEMERIGYASGETYYRYRERVAD